MALFHSNIKISEHLEPKPVEVDTEEPEDPGEAEVPTEGEALLCEETCRTGGHPEEGTGVLPVKEDLSKLLSGVVLAQHPVSAEAGFVGTRTRQCWEKFLAPTVEYQLRLVAKSKKENYIVITVWVLINTSKEIQEPTVLDEEYSCC